MVYRGWLGIINRPLIYPAQGTVRQQHEWPSMDTLRANNVTRLKALAIRDLPSLRPSRPRPIRFLFLSTLLYLPNLSVLDNSTRLSPLTVLKSLPCQSGIPLQNGQTSMAVLRQGTKMLGHWIKMAPALHLKRLIQWGPNLL